MFYTKRWNFRCGVNALVYKRWRFDHYHIWFEDAVNGNNFETFCSTRNNLYRVLKAGMDYLVHERRPMLEK